MNSLAVRYDVLEGIADSIKREDADNIQTIQMVLQDRMDSVPGAKELFLVDDNGKTLRDYLGIEKLDENIRWNFDNIKTMLESHI